MRRRIVPYNAANEKLTQLANASCLISGNCSAIRNQVVTRFIANSYGAGNTSVIVIDFTDHDMDPVFQGAPYKVTAFDIDTDVCGYDPFYGGDMGQAVRYIKHKATTLGYPHDQTVQIIKYITLLQTINDQLGLQFESLREINHHYDSVERIGEALEELVRKQKIRPSDMKSYVSTIKAVSDSLISTSKVINNILSKHTGKIEEEIETITRTDTYFTATEAISFGLADEIADMKDLIRKDER